jgi:hypothetical protein
MLIRVKTCGKRKLRWLGCAEKDFRKLGAVKWMHGSSGENLWRAVVERAKTQTEM